MSQYQFTAIQDNGLQVKGERFASNPQEARRLLEEEGFFVQSIKLKKSALGKSGVARIKDDLFQSFTHEFATLLKAGIHLPKALQTVLENKKDARFISVIESVLKKVNQGNQLSEACETFREYFDDLFIASIKTGEKSGDLSSALLKYNEYLKQRSTLQKKVRSAMAYPIFLIVVFSAILLLLVTLVMPGFVSIYADFDSELPLPTRILMNFSQNIHWYLSAIIVSVMVLRSLFRHWKQSATGAVTWGTILEKLPVIGGIHRQSLLIRYTRGLSTLLSAGTPLTEAMDTAVKLIYNKAVYQRFLQIRKSVEEGKGFGNSLLHEPLFTPVARSFIASGESSGELATMLEEVSLYYDEILKNRLDVMMRLVEPALILVMGIIVGSAILAIYLPIFQLVEIIH